MSQPYITIKQYRALVSCHKSIRFILHNIDKSPKWRVRRLYCKRPKFQHTKNNDQIDRIIKKMQVKHIIEDYYDPEDYPQTTSYGQIFLIPKECYQNIGSYYYTFLHELCHWASRPGLVLLTDRDLDMFPYKMSDEEAYAYEEAIVDLSAAKLCDKLGIKYNYKATARYVWHFIKRFPNPWKILLRVNKMSRKLVKFIMNKIINSNGGGL